MSRPRRTSRAAREAFGPGFLGRTGLRAITLFRTPLRALGIDVPSLRLLLLLELTLADRRRQRESAQGAQGPGSYGLALSCVTNLLLGLFAAITLAAIDDPLWGIALAQMILMAFTALMLITDYLPGIVDSGDIDVVAATPVDDRTVAAARIAHALLFLGVSVAALGLPPLIAGCIRFGPWPFAPMWLVASVFAAATCAGLSLLLFLLLMRIFDVERFRDALLWGQVLATVAFVGGFQIMPHLHRVDGLDSVLASRPWWLLALPPFHTAGLVSATIGDASRLTLTLAALAVVVPLVATTLLFRVASTGFVAHLAAMATGSRSASVARPRRRPVRDLLLRNRTSRAGYDFFAALSRRERTFRMRAYPAVAIAIVISGGLLLGRSIPDPRLYCGAIYYLGMFAPMFVMVARFSDHHQARWVFRSVPVRRYGEFLLGSFTALVVTFVAPVTLAAGALVVALGGITVVPDALFATCTVLMTTALGVLILGRNLPFTEQPVKNTEGGQVGVQMLLMFGSAVWIALHLLLALFPPLLWAGVAVLPVCTWLILRAVRDIEPELGRL